MQQKYSPFLFPPEMTQKQWLDRWFYRAYFAGMGYWKSLVVVVLVSLSYIFARRYFPYVAIFGGLLWVSQYFRSLGEADPSGPRGIRNGRGPVGTQTTALPAQRQVQARAGGVEPLRF